MNKPPKHIDHIKNHITSANGAKDFVPPKAVTSAEQARRHDRLPGHLLSEFEQKGWQGATILVKAAVEPEDIEFLHRFIAPAGEVSAFYRKFQSTRRMRRVGHLANLGFDEEELCPTSHDVLEGAKDAFSHAAAVSHGLVRAYETRARDIPMHREALGSAMGDASLLLVGAYVADSVRPMRPYATQMAVRDASLAMFERSRTMSREIGGTHPSIAGLAYPDSDYAVHLRRSSDIIPPAMREAIEEINDVCAMPR